MIPHFLPFLHRILPEVSLFRFLSSDLSESYLVTSPSPGNFS